MSPEGVYVANGPVDLTRSANLMLARDKAFLKRTFGAQGAEGRNQSVIVWLDLSGRDLVDSNYDEGGYHYALITPGPPDPARIQGREDLGGVIFDRDVMPLPIFSEILGRGRSDEWD